MAEKAKSLFTEYEFTKGHAILCPYEWAMGVDWKKVTVRYWECHVLNILYHGCFRRVKTLISPLSNSFSMDFYAMLYKCWNFSMANMIKICSFAFDISILLKMTLLMINLYYFSYIDQVLIPFDCMWQIIVVREVPNMNILTHYSDVIMGTMASQITSLTIVYSTDYSDADQRKHQSSVSLAFVRRIHRGPVIWLIN